MHDGRVWEVWDMGWCRLRHLTICVTSTLSQCEHIIPAWCAPHPYKQWVGIWLYKRLVVPLEGQGCIYDQDQLGLQTKQKIGHRDVYIIDDWSKHLF